VAVLSAGPHANHLHFAQKDNHASTSPHNLCRPDALPAAQPTVSNTKRIPHTHRLAHKLDRWLLQVKKVPDVSQGTCGWTFTDDFIAQLHGKRISEIVQHLLKLLARVSQKICTQRLKATVTKRWCLEQLNTFQFVAEGVQRQIKSMDMCRKTVPKQ